MSALPSSVNAGFIGERGLWNIEIAADPENDKSKINTLYLETAEDQNLGSQYMHFNKWVNEASLIYKYGMLINQELQM